MNKKCIIFSRVSSQGQEYAQQTETLRQLALQYGYQNHIIIQEKESGIKLSEEERLGLNRMKEIIRNKEADCVFCREVSRLARTKKVLFSVEQFLIEEKVQLIILEPRIQLLDEDTGRVNDSAEIVFTLFAQQAESEMRIKKERFREGKIRCRKSGIWDGTPLPFGYSVNEQQRVILSPQADTVRLIYNCYSTEDFSTNTLAQELEKRGIVDDAGCPLSQSRIARILSTERYTGEDIYPQIITRELFEKCKELRKNAKVMRNLRKNNYASQYLCNKLIVCPECGYHFTPGSTTYRCFMHHHDANKCGNKLQINIELIDNIAWTCARDLEVGSLLRHSKSKVHELNAQKIVLEEKKKNLSKKLESFASRIEKVQDLFIDGLIDKEKAQQKIKKIEIDNLHIEEEITAVNNDSMRISAMIDMIINTRLTINDIEKLNESLPANVEKKRQIVRTHLQKIEISDWQYENIDFVKEDFSVELKRKRFMLIKVYDKYWSEHEHENGNIIRTWKYYPKWTFGKSRCIEITSSEE